MKRMSLVICLLVVGTFAQARDKAGNGGDPVGLEFEQVGHAVIRDLQQHNSVFIEINVNELSAALDSAKVIVTNKALRIADKNTIQDSAAENIPEQKTIFINRRAWRGIFDPNLKSALVLHELLGLLGLEKTGIYTLSSRYLTQIKGEQVGQNFHCESYAALLKLDGDMNPTLSSDLRDFDFSWAQSINGATEVHVLHSVGGTSYVANFGISDLTQNNQPVSAINYVISKTMDALDTTIAEADFEVQSHKVPENFTLPLRPIKIGGEKALYFSVTCHQM